MGENIHHAGKYLKYSITHQRKQEQFSNFREKFTDYSFWRHEFKQIFNLLLVNEIWLFFDFRFVNSVH